MKRIFKLLIICFFTTAFSACSDFLDQELVGTYSDATFYKSQEHAILAINGAYQITSFSSADNALWVFGDVASDDAIKGGNPGDAIDIQFIDEFSYNNTNGYLEKVWKHYYEGISRANYILYYVPDIDMDNALKNRILGEARFLRAFFHFKLANIFGDIPLKLEPPLNSSAINKPKTRVELVYNQVIDDLEAAAEVLDRDYLANNKGRATKGAAYGLLAKVHLYQGNWEKALEMIEKIEELGIYRLTDNYIDNFRDSTQNSIESIFEIQHISGQSPRLGNHMNQWFAPLSENGYFFNAPTQDFVDEFEVTQEGISDPRLDYTVGRAGAKWLNGEAFDPSWSPTGYLLKKHQQPLREVPRGLKGDGSLNYVYLRYADILLMKAESLNELDRPDEALVPLNEVRKRARESYLYDQGLEGYGSIPEGLLPDETSTDKSFLRNAIRHERRVELGGEFHRYFDLMRYGEPYAENALQGTNFNFEQHRYFLIPLSEIDTNPSINE